MNTHKGTLEMIAAMVISGTIGIFVLESGLDSYNVVFFRCLFAAAGLILLGLYRGYLSSPELSVRQWLLIVTSGVVLVLNWLALFEAIRLASIASATVVYHMQPFFLLILSAVILKEQFTRHQWGWLVVAFGGVVLIVDPFSQQHADTLITGLLLALLAAFLYGVVTFLTKQLKGVNPSLVATVQVTIGTIMLLPFADFSLLPEGNEHWFWLVGLGLIHTCLMYTLIYSAYQQISTSAIALLSYIYPATAILMDYIVYGELLSVAQWVGIIMILLAGLANHRGWPVLPGRPATTADATN